MKRFFCFLGMLCAFFSAGATGNTTMIYKDAALKVGDMVPDLVIGNVLNNAAPSLRLSDFRGKLLVIDFWATSCASCVTAMPMLESLQRQFAGKMQLLAVSDEKQERVTAFLQHNPTGKAMRLPVVFGDTRLKALFPHKILSHEVWIGADGKVLAVTGPEYVNAGNIQLALAGGPFHLPVKTDVMDFDYSRPLLGGEEAPLYYSGVSAFKPGVAPRFGAVIDSVAGKVRTYMFNFPLLQLYMMAEGSLLYFPKTLLDIRLRDSSRIRVPRGGYRDEWKQRNSWCYESVLPAATSNRHRMEAMRQDLNRYFGLNGRMEKRIASSLSLERLEGAEPPLSKGGVPLNTLHSKGGEKVLRNAALDDLIWELNDIPGGLPATDNTGIDRKVDLRLPLDNFSDTGALNRALAPFGLVVREKMQELQFFVLTDATD